MSKEAPCPGIGAVPLYLQLECIVYLLLVDGLLSGTPQAPLYDLSELSYIPTRTTLVYPGKRGSVHWAGLSL